VARAGLHQRRRSTKVNVSAGVVLLEAQGDEKETVWVAS
jgi:hypothetical protein